MHEVLKVKDRTGGLSTDRLGGRNIHPWLMPLDLPDQDRGCAGLVRDRRIAIPGAQVEIPMLDMAHALLNRERHQMIVGG